MELFILIIFSALSIAIYYLVTDKLGFTQSVTLSDSQTATDFFLQDYDLGTQQQLNIKRVDICNHQRSALFQFENNNDIGLLNSRGSKWVTQMLSRASIQTVSIEKNSLQIRLNDFAAPKISLYFENDQIRSFWHVTLRDLRS